jgi:spore germination protein YaaH
MALLYRFDLPGDRRVESFSPPAPPMLLQRTRNLAFVLVTLALAIGFGPGSAQANSSQNRAQLISPRLVASTSGPQREVFGFALASSLSDPTVGYPSWNFSLLSTVAFFGLHVNGDGTFANDSDMTVWNSSEVTNLVSVAHSHGTKVVLTIVLQDFSAGTPTMCAGLMHASTTIANTVAQISAKGVDGVNVDYEGLNGSCGTTDSSWARHAFTNVVGSLRAALPAGSYLSVDTYASSAADSLGFFDVKGLSASVDSFFVMAYDLEYSNYLRAPLGCSSFCLGPTAPLGGYYYNDASVTNQYLSVVPASKVILGVPYYGRKACVGAATPNAYPTSGVVADTYLDASQEYTSSLVKPGSYAAHRDANDPAGQERWDTWINTSLNCVRELYWDDPVSLGHKYALVNSSGLRGVGIWNLNYGGGAAELWSLLNSYFECQVSISLPASVATTEFNVGLSAGSCPITRFDVQVFDSTLNAGWYDLASTLTGAGVGEALGEGYRGHTYLFRARAHSTAGVVGSWTTVSTQVSATATLSHPFAGLYTLDAYGGVNADVSPPLSGSAYWPNWKIARAAHALPGAGAPQSGLVLDGYGGLHRYGASIASAGAPYWGWDIARDFAFLPDGSGGYVLDGYGGLHPFGVNGHAPPAAARGTWYSGGIDLARKVAIFSDGTGGYVLDAYGGLHPFGIGGAAPAAAAGAAYWPGLKIARDVALIPGTHAGYVLDGYGGIHPFNGAKAMAAPAYWPGWDIARSLVVLPGSTLTAPQGYTLDGYGGLHPFGGAPALTGTPYWGRDIAIGVWGA